MKTHTLKSIRKPITAQKSYALTQTESAVLGFLCEQRHCYGQGFYLLKDSRDRFCEAMGFSDKTLSNHLSSLKAKGAIDSTKKKVLGADNLWDVKYSTTAGIKCDGPTVQIDAIKKHGWAKASFLSQMIYWVKKKSCAIWIRMKRLAREAGISKTSGYRYLKALLAGGSVETAHLGGIAQYLTEDTIKFGYSKVGKTEYQSRDNALPKSGNLNKTTFNKTSYNNNYEKKKNMVDKGKKRSTFDNLTDRSWADGMLNPQGQLYNPQ